MKQAFRSGAPLALLAALMTAPCHAQGDDREPGTPPAGSSCSDSVARGYAEVPQFTGPHAMTDLARLRYPGARVRMGVGPLVHARMLKGECLASVPFYFVRTDRLELWAVVLVDATHKARFISAWAADFQPFDAWLDAARAGK